MITTRSSLQALLATLPHRHSGTVDFPGRQHFLPKHLEVKVLAARPDPCSRQNAAIKVPSPTLSALPDQVPTTMQHNHQKTPLQCKHTRNRSSNTTSIVTCCSTHKKCSGCSVVAVKACPHYPELQQATTLAPLSSTQLQKRNTQPPCNTTTKMHYHIVQPPPSSPS